jgi:hypothetical protein
LFDLVVATVLHELGVDEFVLMYLAPSTLPQGKTFAEREFNYYYDTNPFDSTYSQNAWGA